MRWLEDSRDKPEEDQGRTKCVHHDTLVVPPVFELTEEIFKFNWGRL